MLAPMVGQGREVSDGRGAGTWYRLPERDPGTSDDPRWALAI